jgi:vacuolar-type H+-ATPase subunit I/STV1
MPYSNEWAIRRVLTNEEPPKKPDELEAEIERRVDEIRKEIGRLIPEAQQALREHARRK